MSKSAVIIIDMLNDFVSGAIACERAKPIIPPLKRLVDAAHRNGVPVIFSNDAHRAEVDVELRVWGQHAMEGTKGAQVIPEIAPQPEDYVVPKRRYSGFFGTDLDALLRELEADTVVLAGLHANMCVRHTAADAFYLGYDIVVPRDGVESFTEGEYQEGLEYLKRIYGATISTVSEVIKRFAQEAGEAEKG